MVPCSHRVPPPPDHYLIQAQSECFADWDLAVEELKVYHRELKESSHEEGTGLKYDR